MIAHQTNCKGAFKTGVAGAIRKTFPDVAKQYEEYVRSRLAGGWESSSLLGKVQFVHINEKQTVANMFCQEKYGYDGARYTSYDAFATALNRLKQHCLDNGKSSLAFPCRIGCVRGGANWNVIKVMIVETFSDTDLNLEFWDYPG